MNRFLGALIGSGTVAALGFGATAWAGPGGLGIIGGVDSAKREAARTCLDAASNANPDADREAIREAVKLCLTEAGIEVREPTEEQKARRQAMKECADGASDANPDAERDVIHEAIKACLAEAGITLPDRPFGPHRPLTEEQKAARETAKVCMTTARGANPGEGAEIRQAVREATKACLDEAGIEPGDLGPRGGPGGMRGPAGGRGGG